MPKRTDRNQREIVAALRKAGCSVILLHAVGKGCPDILAGRGGRCYLLEIKSEKGTSTPAQVEWSEAWRGHMAIVRTPDEAIAAVMR